MSATEEMDAFEAALMTDPEYRAEVEKFRPIMRKISDIRLLAMRKVMREEIHRRAAEPVRIGNR